MLVFGGFSMQNRHFQKSAPGVGGGTILVVLEGSREPSGRALVVLGGSWGGLGSLLGRLEWLLAALGSQGSVPKAILAILGGHGQTVLGGGGDSAPFCPPTLARSTPKKQQGLQYLEDLEVQQDLHQDLSVLQGLQGVALGLQGVGFTTASHAWWPRRGRRILL